MKVGNSGKFMRLKHYGALMLAGGSWDSVVGVATRYGLEGRGSNPGVGEIFRTCSDRL